MSRCGLQARSTTGKQAWMVPQNGQETGACPPCPQRPQCPLYQWVTASLPFVSGHRLKTVFLRAATANARDRLRPAKRWTIWTIWARWTNTCSPAVHTVHTVHSSLREQQLSISDRLAPFPLFPLPVVAIPPLAGRLLLRPFTGRRCAGEVTEWTIVQHWKCCVPARYPGFESLPLRQLQAQSPKQYRLLPFWAFLSASPADADRSAVPYGNTENNAICQASTGCQSTIACRYGSVIP